MWYYTIIASFTTSISFLLFFYLLLHLLFLLCSRFLLYFLSFLFWLFRLLWLFLLFLFFWFLLLRFFFLKVWNKVSSYNSLKNLGNPESIFSLIIFENTTKSSLSCTKSSIKHVNVLFLFFLNKIRITSFFFAPHLTSRFLDW